MLRAISADNQLIDGSDKSLSASLSFKSHSHSDAMGSVARLHGYACMFCANETISKYQQRLMSDEIKRAFVCWQKRQDDFSELPSFFYKQLQ